MAKKTELYLFLALLFGLTAICGCNNSGGNPKTPPDNTRLRNQVPIYLQIKNQDLIEWGNNDAVYAVAQQAYASQALLDAENASGAFESLDIKAVYITEKDFKYYYEPYKLLLVLNNAGEAEQEAAIELLRADSRIKYANKCNDVPFETVNTLNLVASSDTVKVGDTLTVKPDGALKIYKQTFSFDQVASVSLTNYDKNKKYTPRDFPEADIASVITYKYDFGTYFDLVLSQPGYFNVIKAIDALARSSRVKTINVQGWGFPGLPAFNPWTISDISVADFINKGPFGGDSQGNVIEWRPQPNENNEVSIEALTPGNVTVRYTPLIHGLIPGTEYAVAIEITVLP